MKLDTRETAAILAALRYWQWKRSDLIVTERALDILTIENNGGEFQPFTDDEIDALCERINTDK